MWVGTMVLHSEQLDNCRGFLPSCARREPVRALECLRLGTAIFGLHEKGPRRAQCPGACREGSTKRIILDSPGGCVNGGKARVNQTIPGSR